MVVFICDVDSVLFESELQDVNPMSRKEMRNSPILKLKTGDDFNVMDIVFFILL
jgi:hypothetical protein